MTDGRDKGSWPERKNQEVPGELNLPAKANKVPDQSQLDDMGGSVNHPDT